MASAQALKCHLMAGRRKGRQALEEGNRQDGHPEQLPPSRALTQSHRITNSLPLGRP